MDWLDQYLHELNRPGTVVHLPPDKQSWNRPNPTKQQLSLIQDATIADMVRMRNIQEARQAEIDAGMGGGYDAGSAAKERTTVSPVVPAGIPVASTNTIIVTDTNYEWNGTYQKEGNFFRNENDYYEALTYDQGGSGQWSFYSEDTFYYVFATPPSSNINYIATTGWPASLTITAA